MAIQINGNGTITGISVGGLPDGIVDTDMIANGAASGAKLTMPSGSIIQVVQTMKTDTFSSTTATTWTDITGVSVNITPSSASNKILISFHGACGASDDSYSWLRLARVIGGTTDATIARGASRNNTVLCTLDGTQGVQTNKSSTANHSSFEFLDSPNTTSQITYKMQFYKAMGTNFIIGGTYADFDLNKGSVPTFMTAKEVTG